MLRCLKLLSASGTLSKLDLVVPCSFAIAGFPRLPLNADNFAPGSSIKLLRLRKLGFSEPPDISQSPMRRRTRVKEGDEVVEYAEIFPDLRAYAKEPGWEYEVMQYDGKGRYPPYRGDDPQGSQW